MEVTEAVKVFEISVAEAPQRMHIVFGVVVEIQHAVIVHHVVAVGIAVDFSNQIPRSVVLFVGVAEYINGGICRKESYENSTGNNHISVAHTQL